MKKKLGSCVYGWLVKKILLAAQLDSIGFSIIRKCIHAVETRGINEQGLYRIVGVNSRVQKLLSVLMDPKTASETETDICAEWEIKTITSALKTYLRMLPGPLMMYQFQRSFIKAAMKSALALTREDVHVEYASYSCDLDFGLLTN
ncbi:N-chimaerin isoform 2 [Camelus ferus]|nr:N-chimaerin isoform 2 [Camelus ferus]